MDGITSRPKIFKEVIGQDAASTLLVNTLKTSKFARAYLFAGPRAIGKTTLAKLFARAALCSNRDPVTQDPCNKCPSCLSFFNDNHRSHTEEDAGRFSSKDNIESLLESLNFETTGLRIIHLDEVHRISEAGKDAILKTLEKPVSEDNTIFIFSTSELHKLPETLQSRCVRVPLRLPTAQDVLKKLVRVCDSNGATYDNSALKMLAEWSGGHFREAENALEPLLLMGGITYENVTTFTAYDVVGVSSMLVSLNSNLQEALIMSASLCNQFGASALQSSILKVLLEALQFGLSGMKRDTYESVKQVYHTYGNKLGKILAHFATKGKFDDSRLLQAEIVQTYYKFIKGDFEELPGSLASSQEKKEMVSSTAKVSKADKFSQQREMRKKARGEFTTSTKDTITENWGSEKVDQAMTLKRT